MPKNPTAGELSGDNPTTGQSADQPLISDGVESTDEVSTHKPASDSEQDVSGDFERQYPPARPDDEDVPEEPSSALMEDAAEEAKAEEGSIWAKYHGSVQHMRGITLADQATLGVPEDARVDNSEAAKPRTMVGPIDPGLWFTLQNRHRAEVTDAHPILLEFLQEDADFELVRY